MSADKYDLSGIIGLFKRGLASFADCYSTAVKNGANEAGAQIIEELEKLDKPSDISVGKLVTAVKSGVQHAGEHMIVSGLEVFENAKSKAKQNKKRK